MEITEFLTPEVIVLLGVVLFFCFLFLLAGRSLGLRQGRKLEAAEWESHKLEKIVKARLKQSRAVLGGLVTEHKSRPSSRTFPLTPATAASSGSPLTSSCSRA